MADLRFHKMHGCGNDFVIIDGRWQRPALDEATVRHIADRRRGVGFDQLVLIEPAAAADARLVFMNADGSEAGACGNGTRCAARLLGDELGRDALTLDTVAGVLRAQRVGGHRWSVAMPAPRFGWRDVPLARECDTTAVALDIDELPPAVALSLGNPHAVFFVDDVTSLDVERLGRLVERHPMFPARVNAGFAQVLAPDRLRLRVFERGAGLTLACGSGACAAMAAARRLGRVGERVTVQVDGGELEIVWVDAGPVTMTGPTVHVFSGTIPLEPMTAR